MKKFGLTFLALGVMLLASCGVPKKSEQKIQVVTTIFPEYDWVREIAGSDLDGLELTLLTENGTDLHSYQPSVQDMAKIASADIFIYVGGESDAWVTKALLNATNKDMTVINLLETLGDNVKEEEIKEGMQAEDEHDHEGEEHHEEEEEYDEHVWLSLRNAATICEEICSALCKKIPAKEEAFKANAASYVGKLNALDAKYQSMVKNADLKTVLFADRFPFRYLVDDYGLDYYAAFVGCSAETEASFKTVIFLAQKVDDLNLPFIFIIETGDQKIAKTVIDSSQNKSVGILKLNSMQGVTLSQAEGGTTYLGIMEENCTTLEQALRLGK